MPNTRWPTAKDDELGQLRTTPEKSEPGILGLGYMKSAIGPCRNLASNGFTLAATTSIKIWSVPGAGTGEGKASSSQTQAAGGPCPRMTTAPITSWEEQMGGGGKRAGLKTPNT